MNQCAKVLLHLAAPGKVDGRFSSFATLLAIEPACFSNPQFPQSLDKKTISKVVDKMFKPFTKTPYCSPYGVTVAGFTSQGRVVISLTGGMIINALEGKPAPRKEPLDVKTSFNFTEVNGRWVAWAYLADEKAAAELNKAKITFKGIATATRGRDAAEIDLR